MRILIANSVPLIRQKIREAFSEMGYYRFFEAGCGATALEKIENGIDILITDLRLDHVDGLEMIRIFKQTNPGVETQIIVISHDNSRSLMDEPKALGVSYSIFLKKHADLRRLQEMLVDLVPKMSLPPEPIVERVEEPVEKETFLELFQRHQEVGTELTDDHFILDFGGTRFSITLDSLVENAKLEYLRPVS